MRCHRQYAVSLIRRRRDTGRSRALLLSSRHGCPSPFPLHKPLLCCILVAGQPETAISGIAGREDHRIGLIHLEGDLLQLRDEIAEQFASRTASHCLRERAVATDSFGILLNSPNGEYRRTDAGLEGLQHHSGIVSDRE